jgi:CRP/FNR family transcriptional regulator, cyclic AMP receptor protein
MNLLWENLFRKSRHEDVSRKALRENFLFQDLSSKELQFISELVHKRTYHSGETVFQQNDVGVGMYIVVAGRIEVFVSDPSAPESGAEGLFITQLSEGDFFGEIALVEDSGHRTATAIARDETTLLGFFRPDLTEVLARNPSAGSKIILRLAEVLGRRLKETTEKVSDLRKALKELGTPPPFEARK